MSSVSAITLTTDSESLVSSLKLVESIICVNYSYRLVISRCGLILQSLGVGNSFH